MTRSVYIVGAAASGKSTFMRQLLGELGAELGPVEDLCEAPKTNGARVKLRGHYWDDGVYLGVQRELHPGADGLDKACQPAALLWLELGIFPRMIVGEGALLSNREFLSQLPNLLLVHLTASPEETARRCAQRGSTQAASFIAGTATRARNAVAAHRGPTIELDTADELQGAFILDVASAWLRLP